MNAVAGVGGPAAAAVGAEQHMVPMAPDVPVGLVVTLALVGIVLAAVLRAGEAALERITRSAAADMVASGRRGAASVARLAEHPAPAFMGTAFVRVLAEMTAATCITLAVAAWFSAWWHVLAVSILATALVLALIVGASPRGFGHQHPAAVLSVLAPMMVALSFVAGPLDRIWRWSRSGRTVREEEDEVVEELREMVDRVSDAEQIEDDERELLQSVFELGRTRTREVMVPRTTMVTLTATTTAEKAVRLFVRSGYSRVPVIGQSVDDVVGVLYLKDVLRRVQSQPGSGAGRVAELVRAPAFVPETKPVDDLMREMQQSSTHMAMVVDEYGGIAGLVTIEDCLEEIVGELRDEHDRAEPDVEEVDEGVWRVPARLPIHELGDLFDVELHDDEVDSAGGLLAKALGKVPIPGAAAEVHGLHLQAERAEGRRRQIATLLVRRAEQRASASPAETATFVAVVDEGGRPGRGTPRDDAPSGRRA